MKLDKDMVLEITGLGVILYSKHAVSHIKEDEDYLSSNYMRADQVLDHIYKGSIVSFCTRSPGTYILRFREGYPSEEILDSADYVLILGIHVTNRKVFVRDLYDLMEWSDECPEEQSIELEDGFYQVTLYSSLPDSKIRGDHQIIYLHFEKTNKMPELKYKGVPTLWNPNNPNG